MYISDEEYLEMKKQIESLNARMNLVGKPTNLASIVSNFPYSYIGNVETDIPIFRARQVADPDAWNALSRLAKYVHREVPKFCMDTSYVTYSLAKDPYIRSRNEQRSPRTFSEMTKEQMELSAKMLDEMIEIYNKYFRIANPYVLYDATGNGSYEQIEIDYSEQ